MYAASLLLARVLSYRRRHERFPATLSRDFEIPGAGKMHSFGASAARFIHNLDFVSFFCNITTR